MSLPVLAGGAIMGPAIARADENDNIDKGDQAPARYTIIDVVRPYEVGFIAVDVTNVVKDAMGNDSFERLTGKKVHVKVISRYGSKKTAEQDTNNEGVANIDIKQLAENPNKKDVNSLDTYACNATVQVTCPGYRSFETSLIRVTGGTGLMIPLHPADAKGV